MGHYLSEMPDGYRDMIARVGGDGRPTSPGNTDDLERLRAERDRYWQALVDIAGLENWQRASAPQVARRALGEKDS
jgi:hypothetical protein